MEEKANEYLSVKDIARIKSKHEETIRRWISNHKIEVPKFTSKKEGYSIPVDSLIASGILTREEIEHYRTGSTDPVPQTEESPAPLPEWRSLLSSCQDVSGEDLLNLITELSGAAKEYGRKKKQLTSQILSLKNRIAELEYEAESIEGEYRELNDYLTYLRSKL